MRYQYFYKKMLTTISILAMCISLQAQSSDHELSNGDNAMKALQYDIAERAYTRAIEIDPDNTEAWIKRSQLYQMVGRVTESMSDRSRAMSINPYAQLYLNDDFRKNVLALRSSAADQSDDQYGRSWEDLTKTIDYIQLINGYDLPPVDLSFLELAMEAIEDGQIDTARQYLRVLEVQGSVSALSEDLHGIIDLKQDNIEDAIVHFTSAIKLNPSFSTAYHNRAVAYQLIGAYDNSKADFDRAIALNAESAKTYFAKAKLKEKVGDIEGAKRNYKLARDYDVDVPGAEAKYSRILKATGDYSRAMQEITIAIDEEPDVAMHYFTRGGIYFIYGEYDKAEEDYSIYLDSHPEDAYALFNRGIAQLMLDRIDEGCEDINNSLDYGYDGQNADIALYMCP